MGIAPEQERGVQTPPREAQPFLELLDTHPWAAPMLWELGNHHADTLEHSFRMASLIHIVAPDDDLQLAALLHDVGKTHIDPELLDFPGRLDESQRRAMEEHARKGFAMIQTHDQHIATLMLGVHPDYPSERPEVDEETARQQKLLELADKVDALRTERGYKEPWSSQDTIDELRESFPEGDVRRMVAAWDALMP